jgi:hypothetical protein
MLGDIINQPYFHNLVSGFKFRTPQVLILCALRRSVQSVCSLMTLEHCIISCSPAPWVHHYSTLQQYTLEAGTDFEFSVPARRREGEKSEIP